MKNILCLTLVLLTCSCKQEEEQLNGHKLIKTDKFGIQFDGDEMTVTGSEMSSVVSIVGDDVFITSSDKNIHINFHDGVYQTMQIVGPNSNGDSTVLIDNQNSDGVWDVFYKGSSEYRVAVEFFPAEK